ncbi:MAG: hypothetical protein U5R31_10610 [Acidimicrobiia bacterium]|nr:hypothetical protein [Acidimicrobiia bacterium]
MDDLTAGELTAVLELAADVPSRRRVLAGRGAALVFAKPSARDVQLDGDGGGAARRSSGDHSRRGGRPRHTRVDRGRHPNARLLPRGDRRPGLRARRRRADGSRRCRTDRQSPVGRGAPAPGARRPADHPRRARWLRRAFGGLRRRRQQRGALAGCGGGDGRPRPADRDTPDFAFPETDLDRLRNAGADPLVTTRAEEAVEGADVVYTDVWTSMGQESEAEARRRAFEGFTVDRELVDRLAPGGIVLHCLPAHRGEEISAEVVDGERSRVWRQAENRMHAARGLLAWLLEGS